MSKLIYRYATMGSGKTREIISVKYNYEQIGDNCLVFVSDIVDKVESRNGDSVNSISYSKTDNLYELFKYYNEKYENGLRCIIVDECQFLTVEQVYQITDVVDYLNITVMCYGLTTDFRTGLFPASKALFELANVKEELTVKKLCPCGKKALVNARFEDGKITIEGETEVTRDVVEYKPLCRKCFKEAVKERYYG